MQIPDTPITVSGAALESLLKGSRAVSWWLNFTPIVWALGVFGKGWEETLCCVERGHSQ